MHIGITGPISVAPFADLLPADPAPPPTYSFPLVGKLARSLVERGHRVSVFAESTEISEVWKSSGKEISLTVIPLRKRRAAYDFYKRERALLSAEMAISDCDLLHAHWTYEFAAAALSVATPCLVTAHDSPFAILRYFICTRYFPFWTAKAILGARVVRRARHLTTVSPYCQRAIQAALRPRAAIKVVANGVDEELIERGRSRLRNGPPETPFTVATVMEGFQERKNPENALRAFARLRKDMRNARMLMFGTGFGPDGQAEQWARYRGLRAGVEFVGKTQQDDLFRRLQQEVHVLLHPAREESFGMAPLEAMALGLPAVGGKRSGGVPYVLDDGKAGILTEINRPEAIAKALLRLAQDSALSQHIATAGHARAAATFPLQKMVDAYENEYRKVLGAQ